MRAPAVAARRAARARALLLAALLALAGGAAAQSLQVIPLTWDVVGLDSNDVNTGPNAFPVGARVCNVGSGTVAGVEARFVEVAPSTSLVSLADDPVVPLGDIPAGPPPPSPWSGAALPSNCRDAYFTAAVQRTTLAFGAAQGYRIDAAAGGAVLASSPTPRQIYVERLVSQGRNSVLSLTGPATAVVGEVVTIRMEAQTATQGYEQLVAYPELPNVMYRIEAVRTSYSAPAGARSSTLYGDACGWVDDPTSPAYLNQSGGANCSLPDNYPGGKAGGRVVSEFDVRILSGGDYIIHSVIYDYSGNSYHLNADYGSGGRMAIALRYPPEAEKAFAPAEIWAGGTSRLGVTIRNANGSPMTGVAFEDAFPAGVVVASAPALANGCGGTATATPGSDRLRLEGGVVPANGSCTVEVDVVAAASGTYENVIPAGGVTSGEWGSSPEPAAATLVARAHADLTLTKSAELATPILGEPFRFELRVANAGPDAAEGVVAFDGLPPELVFVAEGSDPGCGSGDGAQVLCDLGTIAPGGAASASFVVDFAVDDGGAPLASYGVEIVNTASIAASSLPDLDPSGDAGSAAVVPAGLELVKSVCNLRDGPCVDDAEFGAAVDARPGDVLAYRIRYRALAAPAGALRVQDAPPAGTELVSDAYGAGEVLVRCPDGSDARVELAAPEFDIDVSGVCGGAVPAGGVGFVEFRARIL